MPKKQTPPGSRKKEDRRGRRRSSEDEVWDVGMSWRLLSGRRGLYIFSQGGLEAGKTDVLFSMPEHGSRQGWTAVADGGPGGSVSGSGSFHEAGL